MTLLARQLEVINSLNEDTLIKVAFATSDRKTVNEHFGSARSFAVYGIGPDMACLLKVSEFDETEKDGSDNKLAVKIGMLEGCDAVYCCACGASAVKLLLGQHIHPVRIRPGSDDIDLLIRSVQQELRSGPSGWLAQTLLRKQSCRKGEQRFDEMAEESWSE